MNYLNHYNLLIASRKILARKKNKSEIYYESHHIIPKWLGGDNSKNNLVLLTAREHYVAHLLLWKHYRDRPSALAFHRMTKSNNSMQKRIINSKYFELAKIAFIETQLGDKNWTRKNGSPNKGKVSPNKGKKLGQREWMNGNNNPSKRIEVRQKISEQLKGRKKSQEHLNKTLFLKKPKLECQNCFKFIDFRNYGRWHGDKCKVNK